jgi:hypothetical protein
MNMGPTPAELVPGAAIAVTGIGLVKATPESPEALTIDAAVANPASPKRVAELTPRTEPPPQ